MSGARRTRSYRYPIIAAVIGLLVCTGCPAALFYAVFADTETHTEQKVAPPPPDETLTDDRLADRRPLDFDATQADRRPLGDWLVNQSAAVILLDVKPIDPDREADLLVLRPSYAAAFRAARTNTERKLLPSVNLLDGKAKQFDDGLYAALDQAYYRGLGDKLPSHVELVRRLYEKVGPAGAGASYLAAALELAGVHVEVVNTAEKKTYLQAFESTEVAAKPIGFYTWNETLSRCFRFLRFLQTLPVPAEVKKVLATDAALQRDYNRAVAFYSRLTNPMTVPPDREPFFPSSTSREVELFNHLFPSGLPAGADLMNELIRAIRSGKVDLTPRPNSGWYDHQVHALETLLSPVKGEEHDKLLLTRAYKKRMMEAFKALITKRRETHVRQLGIGCGSTTSARRPSAALIRPRLRIEPCPSYYVRTARSYAFLANFLEATLGADTLRTLHGLKPDGERPRDLGSELAFMRDLFYGLYLVSAEDIGLKPQFLAEEHIDTEKCYHLAESWLPTARDDPDLAADTRVSVPIYADPVRRVTRLWMTLGVRLAKLDASYAVPPKIKPLHGGEWQSPPEDSSEGSAVHYLIPVDEFAEVELSGLRTLTRDELRSVCDREKTREAILKAVRDGSSSGGRAWPWLAALGTAVAMLAALAWIYRRSRNLRTLQSS